MSRYDVPVISTSMSKWILITDIFLYYNRVTSTYHRNPLHRTHKVLMASVVLIKWKLNQMLNYTNITSARARAQLSKLEHQRAPLYNNWHILLTHWSRDKIDTISQTTFCSAFSWMKMFELLKFVPKCQINKTPALVQIMAWRHPGDKPLSEPMTVHETSSSPFAQFDLILGWTTWKWLWASWNSNEMLKQPICEQIGHGWRFHALQWWLDYWHIYASLSLNELKNNY